MVAQPARRRDRGDAKCHDQLLALANPQAADDLATTAGTREVASARVVSVDPLVLDVTSRSIGDGTADRPAPHQRRAVRRGETVDVDTHEGGSFKIDGLSIGPLSVTGCRRRRPAEHLRWDPERRPRRWPSSDRLIVADFDWFRITRRNRYLNVARPTPDNGRRPEGRLPTRRLRDESRGAPMVLQAPRSGRSGVVGRARRAAVARGTQPGDLAARTRR